MFTYLDEKLKSEIGRIPVTNNQIEGGVNARLRSLLRDRRGMNIERRIKAVFWWCYMHSPEPLPAGELLKVMPTDKSINDIYSRLAPRKVDDSIQEQYFAVFFSNNTDVQDHSGICSVGVSEKIPNRAF